MSTWWDAICEATPPIYGEARAPWVDVAWTDAEIAALSDADLCSALRYHPPRSPGRDSILTFSALVHEMHRRCSRHRGAQALDTPARYADVDLDSIQAREGQRAAIEAVAEALACGRGCWLSGLTGRGKSYIAHAWLRSAGRAGNPTLTVRWLDVARGWRDERATELQRQAREVAYLVLDDVPARLGPMGNGVLFDVLDARAGNQLATTITSNVAPGAIPDLDARTRTRITEITREVVV
jgi:DNA replication protein DnaC